MSKRHAFKGISLLTPRQIIEEVRSFASKGTSHAGLEGTRLWRRLSRCIIGGEPAGTRQSTSTEEKIFTDVTIRSPMEIMGRFINHHSFSLFAAVSLFALAIYLFRDGFEPNDLVAIGALILGLVIAYGFLRPGPSTLSQVADVEARIGKGEPVLLEFQSPY